MLSRVLSQVQNPVQRLVLEAKDENRRDDAHATLLTMLRTDSPGFMMEPGDRKCHAYFLKEDQSPLSSDPEERLLLRFMGPAGGKPWIKKGQEEGSIAFGALVRRLGLDREKIKEIVRQVADYMMERFPRSSQLHREGGALEIVAETYLEQDDPLILQVRRWYLLCRFYDGRIFEIASELRRGSDTPCGAHEMDPIVLRLGELGMEESSICEAFLAWIKNALENCRPEFMLAIAGAQVYKSDSERADRDKLLATYIQKNRDHHAETLAKMLKLMGGDERRNAEAAYMLHVMDLVSLGKKTEGLERLRILHEAAYDDQEAQKTAEAQLHSLTPKLFEWAWFHGRFGAAAALAREEGHQTWWDTDQARCAQLIADALGQPVRLDRND